LRQRARAIKKTKEIGGIYPALVYHAGKPFSVTGVLILLASQESPDMTS
jgi:hypothetical protein